MKYSADQWVKCRWRIDNVPIDKKVLDEYPELNDIFKPIVKAYKEAGANTDISLDLLVRYIVLTYHRFSPYSINEQNIIKRKIDVCELIGLNPEKDVAVAIIDNKNRFVNNAAMYFLQQEGDMDWLELNQYLDAYYQIMAALTDGSNDSEKKTTPQDIAKTKLGIVKDMKEIKREIETLSAKVFREDTNLLNFVEQYRRDEQESFIILSPEDYIRSKRVIE